MKYVVISLLGVLLFGSCSEKRTELFNGENLDGWTIFIKDSTVQPEDFFYVKDGVIETPGKPLGYLRTKAEYANYKLHIEWRYVDEPTNSGVFLHTTGPDVIWPAHYQGQLKHQNAGDFIVHGSGVSARLNDTLYTSNDSIKPLISKMLPSNEKPSGEWNSYDINCDGNIIELWVNGVLQNRATDCSQTMGGIGLQAEGSKIQYRNLWLESL